MKTHVRSLVLFVVCTVFGPTLGTSEATEPKGAPKPDAVLYELMEEAAFTEAGFRQATSALQGQARPGSPLCPEGLQAYAKWFFSNAPTVPINVKLAPRCTVVAIGESKLDLANFPFRGRIRGHFWVVVNSDATNLTDAQELVVMNGIFRGEIEVTDSDRVIIEILPGSKLEQTSALPGFPLPLPPSNEFPFTGKFRLPFTVHHTAVYKSDRGKLVPVRPDERALGDPTVRLEIDFD